MALGAVGALAATALFAGGRLSIAAAFNPNPVFPIGPISAAIDHQIVKLDQVVSALAGRHVIVNCWNQSDWLRFREWQVAHRNRGAIDANGVTNLSTHRVQLSPFVCQVLAQALARSARQPLFTAWAITVLAHESAHASGIRAENRAECWAIATEPRAAELLGVPRLLALRLQHIYRGSVYPYDVRRYRVPPCPAGRPGVVVPDTLGTPAHLGLFRQITRAVVRALPEWKNLGGGSFVGALSPCGWVKTRSEEAARFDEVFLGPRRAAVTYSAVTLRSKQEFAAALVRIRDEPRCTLEFDRAQVRDFHLKETVAHGRIPASITRLSPNIRAFREVVKYRGRTWNYDRFITVDRARRTITELRFTSRAGDLSAKIERHAIAGCVAALRSKG